MEFEIKFYRAMQGGKFNVVNLISCRRQSACRYLGEILARAAFGALVRAGLRSAPGYNQTL
jgi:hypothetical protein